MKIPVYLVDEEIYSRCPTVILSTVDKFARLPWDVNTNALFGRVDRLCSRDGYVAIGSDHVKHRKSGMLPAAISIFNVLLPSSSKENSFNTILYFLFVLLKRTTALLRL